MHHDVLTQTIIHNLDGIYGEALTDVEKSELAEELKDIMRLDGDSGDPPSHENLWNASDVIMITYGDSVITSDEAPLNTLHKFLRDKLSGVVSGVHVLPFFPYSSDDGFAVIDFYKVNESLGDWGDVRALADDFDLMADLVINHCSSESEWFKNFVKGEGEGSDYFISVDAGASVSKVVRPRTSALLNKIETCKGVQYVWCTFSHDQVDLNFKNTRVLCEFAKIIRLYLDQGVRIFRLDAVAFLWKTLGTDCLNLPQTHEVVRLLRVLIEYARKDAILITETNIPNRENLSYFGNANEAHMIYNFSLPPLLLNTMVSGDCTHLKQWQMSMPPAQNGTTYFNFIASHDGVGLRPAEGLLTEEEVASLINTMLSFGGQVSWSTGQDGVKRPYEINIALFDALQGTIDGPDQWGIDRFICAHAIMLSLEGVPAFYIHSLMATRNDHKKFESDQQKRSINRHRWDYDELTELLDDETSENSQVFERMKSIIGVRQKQKAFHPNATQFTLHLNKHLFGFWRQSADRQQSIFCIFNVSDTPQSLMLSDLNLIVTDYWTDLISGMCCDDMSERISIRPYQVLWITNAL